MRNFYAALCALFPLFSGCTYLSNYQEVLFLKSLDDSQRVMSAQVERDEALFMSLKAAVESGALKMGRQSCQ
jgi:hypothetical protein